MWQYLAKLVLKFRAGLLIFLLCVTVVMGYYASQVKLSYEFSKAIPTDNPKYKAYLAFKEKFGDDGNLLVAGIQTDSLFNLSFFKAYKELHRQLKEINYVEDVLSIPAAANLIKNPATQKLVAQKIFPDSINTQGQLNEAKAIFYNLPFYRSLLYNPQLKAYLVAVRINKDILNSKGRTKVIGDITAAAKSFEEKTGVKVHLSGLPLIRTVVANRIHRPNPASSISTVVKSKSSATSSMTSIPMARSCRWSSTLNTQAAPCVPYTPRVRRCN